MALGRAGCQLVVTSTTERIHERASELVGLGIDAEAYIADLADSAGVDILARQIGPVDILVNNAGMAVLGHFDASASLENISDAMWAIGIQRNLTTAFLMTRAVLPAMKDKHWGRIINIGSTSGAVAGAASDSVYATAKAGMLGLTRSLALEVAKLGITVNYVAPGWIATGSQTDAEARAGAASPIGRSGHPEEVASCVAYLASADASYLTGQIIVVDGGNSIEENRAG
jgi:3-oxoacyl-[acyl-carrier protein] reductase